MTWLIKLPITFAITIQKNSFSLCIKMNIDINLIFFFFSSDKTRLDAYLTPRLNKEIIKILKDNDFLNVSIKQTNF